MDLDNSYSELMDDGAQAESGPASDGRKARSARPERTLHHTVRVTLEDAVAGCQVAHGKMSALGAEQDDADIRHGRQRSHIQRELDAARDA